MASRCFENLIERANGRAPVSADAVAHGGGRLRSKLFMRGPIARDASLINGNIAHLRQLVPESAM